MIASMDFSEMLDQRIAKISLSSPIERESIPDIALYMEQVTEFLNTRICSIYGADDKAFTKMMINNYTKARLLGRPVNKKYDRSHITRLIEIFALKQQFSITQISGLFSGLDSADEAAVYDTYAELSAGIIRDFPQRTNYLCDMIAKSLEAKHIDSDPPRLLLLALLTALEGTLDRRLISMTFEETAVK